MAIQSEMQSLEGIQYKSKIKVYFYPILLIFIFTIAFLNYYPISSELKSFLKKNLASTGCNLNFDEVRFEWLLPKVVVTDLSVPSRCFNKTGEEMKFSYINLKFQFISFSPLGIPFKIETEMNGQPLSIYYVQGFGQKMIRLKDQSLSLSRFESVLGKIKLGGNLTVDLNLLLDGQNHLKNLNLKAQSKDFKIPSQNLQDFITPNLKINDFYIETNSENPSKVTVDKFIIGDPESPIRANFKGSIDIQSGPLAFSPLNLVGEVSLSDEIKEQVPLVEAMFQTFNQKDNFYQIRLAGTLGSPKLSAP